MAGWNPLIRKVKKFQLYQSISIIWHTIISIGITNNSSDWDRKRIRLLNGISAMAILLICFYCLSYLDAAHRLTFWESFQGIVAYSIVLLLTSKHKYNAACHFFSVYNMACYTFEAISHGAIDGAEYILLASSMASLLIFRDTWVIFMYFLLNGICFAICKYSFTVMKPFLFMPNGENLYISNHVTVFIIVFLIVYYFKAENKRQEKLLENENVSLLNEKQQILASQNEKLEWQVKERTHELSMSLTELRAAQQQLIQSEKLASLGELTAGIAHEIQNPLNFVNNFSEVCIELMEELKTEITKDNQEEVISISNDISQNLEKIQYHGKRADAIVKGMLQHSRKSTGQKEMTDINALADEFFRLSYHGLRSKDKLFNSIMQTDFDVNIKNVNIIPQDIGRVFLNLFNNAFYAVAEKGKLKIEGYQPTVFVSTKQLDGQIEIVIRDNGIGIPQKILDKIYQPFFTTKPTGVGTGLGLSLSYDIITNAHGGTLEVVTEMGEFAAFTIKIPS